MSLAENQDSGRINGQQPDFANGLYVPRRDREIFAPASVGIGFGSPDISERKDLSGLGITIEAADLERDSEAVALLYSEESPHLAGVAPGMLSEERYQELRKKYGPLIAATSEGVKGYYEKTHR